MASPEAESFHKQGRGEEKAPENDTNPKPKIYTLERTIQQLTSENTELRSRCRFLDSGQQKSKHLSLEWQNFGKYTAQVLKNEVETAEKKIRLLKERVEKLTKENKELKEMCLYLNQTQGGSDSKLTPPEFTELLVHTKFLSKLNAHSGLVPQYTGLTGGATLNDSRPKRGYVASGRVKDPEVVEALTEMDKRVERLETEKLELIKSLSAAHLLVADTHSNITPRTSTIGSTRSIVEQPPKLNTLIQRGGNSLSTDEVDGGPGKGGEGRIEEDAPREVAPEVISNAVTLLEMIRRLDAAELNGFTDPMDEAEVATLRVLISIAWQRIQEQTFNV